MEDEFPQVAWEDTQALGSADSNLSLRVGLDPEGLSVEADQDSESLSAEGGGRAEPFPIPQCSLPEPYLSVFSQMRAACAHVPVKCAL